MFALSGLKRTSHTQRVWPWSERISVKVLGSAAVRGDVKTFVTPPALRVGVSGAVAASWGGAAPVLAPSRSSVLSCSGDELLPGVGGDAPPTHNGTCHSAIV